MDHIASLTAERAAETFAALGSDQRLAVLEMLVRAGSDGLTIGVLGDRTGVKGSTLTHHLKILATAGLIRQTKHGRATVCVAAAYDEVRALSDFLLRHCCADAPDQKGNSHE